MAAKIDKSRGPLARNAVMHLVTMSPAPIEPIARLGLMIRFVGENCAAAGMIAEGFTVLDEQMDPGLREARDEALKAAFAYIERAALIGSTADDL